MWYSVTFQDENMGILSVYKPVERDNECPDVVCSFDINMNDVLQLNTNDTLQLINFLNSALNDHMRRKESENE